MRPHDVNVAEFLLANKPPGQIALYAPDRPYTYGELSAGVASVAAHLRALSWPAGARVVLAAENSFFWVAAYLGILRAGLVCVPLPVSVSADELSYILDLTESSVVFANSAFARKHSRCRQGRRLVTDEDVSLLPGEHSAATAHGDDLAALMFTSGSTGKPRGVMVTHRNIAANTASIVEYLSLTAEDRMMCVLPLHYCFGASLLHTHLLVGGSVVLESRFMYPEVVLEKMIKLECTGFAGVPSHFQILLRRSALRLKAFPRLRHVQQAGGHLAPALVRELRAALPDARVYVMYGQTEATARLSYLPPELLDVKPGSIGKGIPGVNLTVVNEAGVPVRPGEVGEIVAEGENIALGYWRSPAESAASFRAGKLHTGDLATVDEEGFLYIAGRAKDFLKCGGKRVSCRQLEEMVLEYDEVMEAAVIGVPDDTLGEAVKLFVVPSDTRANGLADRVRLFCRQRLPLPLVPAEIVVLGALPKNAAGKVVKDQLRNSLPVRARQDTNGGGPIALAEVRQ